MSTPLPVISPVTPFGYFYPQFTAATPFTYQDAQTFAKLLESLVKYIDQTLVPEMDANTQALVDAWNASTAQLIDMLLNNSVELQDPVMAAIIADVDSETRAALDLILSSVIQEKPDDPGVFMILQPPVPPVEPGEVVPDPDNPGFWDVA